MSDDTTLARLAENPRTIGALFALSLLLMEAGNVIAGGTHSGTMGP